MPRLLPGFLYRYHLKLTVRVYSPVQAAERAIGDCMRGKKTARSGSAAATKTKLSGGGKVYDPDAPLTAKDYWQMGTTLLIALLLGRYVLYPLLEWYRDSRSSHLGTGSCAS